MRRERWRGASFSVMLPAFWTVVKDEHHEPDLSVQCFSPNQSAYFAVSIERKSNGSSIDSEVDTLKKEFTRTVENPSFGSIKEWSGLSGEGVNIDGTHDATKMRIAIFVFERGDIVCAVVEVAAFVDDKQFAKDFETIRNSFKLK